MKKLTPYQLYYICEVYPESITEKEALKVCENIRSNKFDLSYWKAVYKIIYNEEYDEFNDKPNIN